MLEEVLPDPRLVSIGASGGMEVVTKARNRFLRLRVGLWLLYREKGGSEWRAVCDERMERVPQYCIRETFGE